MPRAIAAVLFAAYLAVLFYLTLFPHVGPGTPPQGGLNLIPFREIAHDLWNGGWPMVVNVPGNVVAFLPLGFLVPALGGSPWRGSHVALLAMTLSILIEALQYASGHRVTDVDDVLLNTLGGWLGHVAYVRLVGRRWTSVPSRAKMDS